MILGAKSRQDGSWSTADREGTGSSSSDNILFQTDFNAASAVLNGFDAGDVNESNGGATITWVNGRAQYNLLTGNLNDVWMAKAFGNHTSVGGDPQNEIWARFIWNCPDFDVLNNTTGAAHKVLTFNWTDATTGTRTFQIIVGTYHDGTGLVLRADYLTFNRTTGQYLTSGWITPTHTNYLTEGKDEYIKVRIVNSTAGASDGTVQLWHDNVLIGEATNVAINDGNGDYPNKLIVGTYNSAQGSTADGIVTYEDLTLSDYDLGAWVGSSVPTWRGYNTATGAVTAADAILDFRDDVSSYGNLATATEGSSYSHIPGGGFYGQGTSRYNNSFSTGINEQYCGPRTITGLSSVGDSSMITIGMLVRWGQGYVDEIMELGSYKNTIVVRNPNTTPTYQRPMLTTQNGNNQNLTNCFCVANGTTANVNNDPINNPQMFNDASNPPNTRILAEQYLWIELQIDCNGPYGWIIGKTWSQDGTYQGETVSQIMTNGESTESFGGVCDYIDCLDAYVPAINITPPANGWHEFELARIIVGSAADITPPPGFPGHNASNWA